ncbi:MAG: TlpA family protein disulfide reductase [Chitinophagaceae bacterium]|nr:MAG: TlpA family protein disulfide reductase [Chitinophagaceae bacterium]
MINRFFKYFLIFISLVSTAFAQDIANAEVEPANNKNSAISLFIGDNAPHLSASKWLKGKPIQGYQRGHVYVLEFWATWCAPCRAAMPHLSKLAREFRREATFIGVDVMEPANVTEDQIRRFVDSMGSKLDYSVVMDKDNSINAAFIHAAGQQSFGIPRTIVIDNYGKLAWMGEPADLAKVLPYIIDRQWDLKKELERNAWNRYIDSLDLEVQFGLQNFRKGSINANDQPDSALAYVESAIAKTPALRYRISTAYGKFSALLKTDQKKALEYGYELFNYTDSIRNPGYEAVIEVMADTQTTKITNTTLYKLAAVCYEKKINRLPYPEVQLTAKMYSSLAYYYWKSGEPEKAINSQKKAVALGKSKNRIKPTELEKLEESLVLYEAND